MSCSKCGCKLHPCRCVFDNEADFIKYGECFFELEVPKEITPISSNDTLDKINSYPIPSPSPPIMFATKEWWEEFWKDIEEWFKEENKP